MLAGLFFNNVTDYFVGLSIGSPISSQRADFKCAASTCFARLLPGLHGPGRIKAPKHRGGEREVGGGGRERGGEKERMGLD